MNQGMYPLAASMVNQLNRLDQISNNLANVNTHGFKQEGLTETTFNHYLDRAKDEGFTPSKINTITNNIPKIDSKFIHGEVGAVVSTGNTLDFALEQPDTFFKVQNKNGDIVYTRDGAFKTMDNLLVDSNGNPVLNNDNEPIVTDTDVSTQLGVVQIDYSNLQKIGDNNYKARNEDEVAPFDNNNGLIISGALEKSNVNSVTTMVHLIDAHRRFEQSQKAMTSIDELNGKIIDKIGNNTR
ncbi:flagellar hook-basal body protein [Poseidonibacter sp.]|uniref:flagellar hook-basal body protein n=1 Tax=Poseidonibacter sp. TaxID=2321188 RepID=UPI003C76C6F5